MYLRTRLLGQMSADLMRMADAHGLAVVSMNQVCHPPHNLLYNKPGPPPRHDLICARQRFHSRHLHIRIAARVPHNTRSDEPAWIVGAARDNDDSEGVRESLTGVDWR